MRLLLSLVFLIFFPLSAAASWLDDARMASDYELVETYLGLDEPFDVKTVYTNEFIDKSIKMSQ